MPLIVLSGPRRPFVELLNTNGKSPGHSWGLMKYNVTIKHSGEKFVNE